MLEGEGVPSVGDAAGDGEPEGPGPRADGPFPPQAIDHIVAFLVPEQHLMYHFRRILQVLVQNNDRVAR